MTNRDNYSEKFLLKIDLNGGNKREREMVWKGNSWYSYVQV